LGAGLLVLGRSPVKDGAGPPAAPKAGVKP
jgi:hypothetical protein